MPKVNLFFFASNAAPAQTPQGPILQVINPTQILVPPYLPGTFSFSLVFGITDFDTSKIHNINIEFIKEGSQDSISSIVNTLQPIQQNPNVELPPDQQGFISAVNLQNVDLSSEGVYKALLSFDGEKIYEHAIYVARKK